MAGENILKASRKERDVFGTVEVPIDALYGVQTKRAIQNFPISGITISHFPHLINALAVFKKAAAKSNAKLGQLSQSKAEIISKVCDEIIAGHHHQHFPVDVFQGGAGNSTNMNINEVIANRGLELMGRRCGEYSYLHPNHDVDHSQSTNEVYPAAVRIALIMHLPRLMDMLTELAEAFEKKGKIFSDIQKPKERKSQHAIPMTLGGEMYAYGNTLRQDIQRLQATVDLLSQTNLGANASGSNPTPSAAFQAEIISELASLTGLALKPSRDLAGTSWDVSVFVHLSGVLKRVATKLSKIANDLRLLSTGPRGGFGEIHLPPVQQGLSLKPGNVNPVIAEMVNQVAFQVIGTDVTITFAAQGGQLQLNAFEPVMAYGLLQSVTLLSNAAEVFRERCIDGISADPERYIQNMETRSANFSTLTAMVGYERASELAREMLGSGETWGEIVARLESTR